MENLKLNKNGNYIIGPREKWELIKEVERKGKICKVARTYTTESIYVSNFGRIKRVDALGVETITYGAKRACTKSGKIYMHVVITYLKDGQKFSHSFKVHRLVAYAFLGTPPDYKYVPNHIDDDGMNNHVYNLEWVTKKKNSQLAVVTGAHRVWTGENHYKAKLSESIINDEIIPKLLNGYGNRDLAEHIKSIGYECSKETIGAIRLHRNWKHLTEKISFPKDKGRKVRMICPDNIVHNICRLIADGKSDREISSELSMGEISPDPLAYVHLIRKKGVRVSISNQYF